VFQFLLTSRYLTSKVMPLLAALAVCLSTAMVLITWSVMGGFLVMLLESGRRLAGDVSIAWPNDGFAYYDDLVDRLERDPEIEAAAPVIDAFGVLGLPDGRVERGVQIRGVEPDSFDRVTRFSEFLWWRQLDTPLPRDKHGDDPRLVEGPLWDMLLEDGRTLLEVDPETGNLRPAVVLGIELSGWNIRAPGGWYEPGALVEETSSGDRMLHDSFLPRDDSVSVGLLPLDSEGQSINLQFRRFPIANEFKTGFYEVDSKAVLMPLNTLQRLLSMDAALRVEPGVSPYETIETESGDVQLAPARPVAEDPARVTHVLVRGRKGLDANELKGKARAIYTEFAQAHADAVPEFVPKPEAIRITTWEDQHRTFISAVKRETGIVLFVFSFISLTAVFLVLAIFWSMVSEKTKDVGILRAIGASRSGVAGIWLSYGLIIGVAGAVLGVILAYLIVTNINPIHDWLITTGERFGQDWALWDPQTYYFTDIPSRVEPPKAAIVFTGGVLASVLGSLIPAWRAATMDPVRALRFE